MTGQTSITDRILTAIHRAGGITRTELAYQLTRRGGAVGEGSLTIGICELVETGRIHVSRGVLTLSEVERAARMGGLRPSREGGTACVGGALSFDEAEGRAA